MVGQGRRGSGSEILASSPEETMRTSAKEQPVGCTRGPCAFTTWRHPPSIRRARAPSTPLRLSACSVLLYPKAHSDDKQKASASYSLNTLQGIQQDMMQKKNVTRNLNNVAAALHCCSRCGSFFLVLTVAQQLLPIAFETEQSSCI